MQFNLYLYRVRLCDSEYNDFQRMSDFIGRRKERTGDWLLELVMGAIGRARQPMVSQCSSVWTRVMGIEPHTEPHRSRVLHIVWRRLQEAASKNLTHILHHAAIIHLIEKFFRQRSFCQLLCPSSQSISPVRQPFGSIRAFTYSFGDVELTRDPIL